MINLGLISSSLNEGNYDRNVFAYQILISREFLEYYFSVFVLVLISIEKIHVYQTLKTGFDHNFKHVKARQKHSLFVVVKTLFTVFGNVAKHSLFCLIYYLIYPCIRC